MKRILPAASLLFLLAAELSACGGAYTMPSRGIDADIQASRATSSATLFPSDAVHFRDTDLSR